MPSPPASMPVAIVGAGPVGLALALGLARHGIRSVVLEREPRLSRHSKAAGIHVRTREALRRWGVEGRFLEAGNLIDRIALHDVTAGDRHLLHLDFRSLDREVDRPGLLVIEQSETEKLLWEALRATGLSAVHLATEVTAVRERSDGVTLTLRREGTTQQLRADHVVGCDGPSSTVRDAMGMPFEGATYRMQPMLADVALTDDRDALPWPRVDDRQDGLTAALRLRPGRWRIIHLPVDGGAADEVPDAEVERRVEAVLGPGPARIVWRSRFRIHRRSSPRFRGGRLLLAGDAAHVHSPVGGQGMNAGIQDAHALAWRLATVQAGGDVDRLLDSYDHERRGVVVGDVSRFTDVLTRVYLQSPSWARRIAFALQRTAMRVPRIERAALGRMSMIDLRLPPSTLLPAERAAGVRLPDPLLRAADGTERRLHGLLPLGAALLEVTGARDRGFVADGLPVDAVLRIGPGGYDDRTGRIRGLLDGRDGWILVRPDGAVAWARTHDVGLAAAIRRSLGRPAENDAARRPRAT
jgi:2-polyprenyl-6-methoxyphenol hydroxylase-like FAD-dependent oxidoreductase